MSNRMGRRLCLALAFVSWSLPVLGTAVLAGEGIVVYSARNEPLIKPVFDLYARKTGVPIQFVTDKEGPLLVRLAAEGTDVRADLLITVDAGTLWQAAEQGLLQPVSSPTLDRNIPTPFRDPKGRFFGLSIRARTIVYHTRRVKPADLSTYEALGEDKWHGRLCLNTSKKIYNQSLVAMMIAATGTEATETVVKSWVKNLATPVFSSDTQVLEAIAASQCDVGIVNTYYYGRLMKKSPGLPLALFFPNQSDRGVHVNISGAGITKHAKHKDQALKFLEWLSGVQAQRLFADANMEYPVNEAIAPTPEVAAWGTFKRDATPLVQAGKLQTEAVKLMDRAGYQ